MRLSRIGFVVLIAISAAKLTQANSSSSTSGFLRVLRPCGKARPRKPSLRWITPCWYLRPSWTRTTKTSAA